MLDDLRPVHPPRVLEAHERAVVEQLLRQPFDGRDQLRMQLSAARVIAERGRDSRTLRFERTGGEMPRAPTALRVPVEGQAVDDDGVPIAVLLHVVDGLIEELEIFRVDGRPIQRRELGVPELVSVNEE